MRVVVDKSGEDRLRVSKYVVVEETLEPAKELKVELSKSAGNCTVTFMSKIDDPMFDSYKSSGECKYVLNFAPFFVQCFYNGHLVMTVNHRQLFNYEAYRSQEAVLARAKDATDLVVPLNFWEQKALLHRAPTPNGPASVAVDFTFNGTSVPKLLCVSRVTGLLRPARTA